MKTKLSVCLLCVFFAFGFNQKNDEPGAIKKLLETESATWRSGDIKAHADCWHVQPYSRILASSAEGATYDIPPAVMINPPAGFAGKGGSSVNSNYKMSINGNTAWVSHDEESTAVDGRKNYTYEIRLLEKIEGLWKLVGQSTHGYKPK